MIEARAAQKLGRSVAVARVLPPSLLSLSLTNKEDIAYPGGERERSSDPPLSATAAAADRSRSAAAAAFHH